MVPKRTWLLQQATGELPTFNGLIWANQHLDLGPDTLWVHGQADARHRCELITQIIYCTWTVRLPVGNADLFSSIQPERECIHHKPYPRTNENVRELFIFQWNIYRNNALQLGSKDKIHFSKYQSSGALQLGSKMLFFGWGETMWNGGFTANILSVTDVTAIGKCFFEILMEFDGFLKLL